MANLPRARAVALTVAPLFGVSVVFVKSVYSYAKKTLFTPVSVPSLYTNAGARTHAEERNNFMAQAGAGRSHARRGT